MWEMIKKFFSTEPIKGDGHRPGIENALEEEGAGDFVDIQPKKRKSGTYSQSR